MLRDTFLRLLVFILGFGVADHIQGQLHETLRTPTVHAIAAR